MTVTAEERRTALARARERLAARDYPGVVDALSGLTTEDLVAEPACGFLVASAANRIGETERALELVRLLEPVVERRNNDRLARDRLNLEGRLLFERGDTAGAERAWLRLADHASRAGDEQFSAWAYNNLGAICALADRHREALVNYERALIACRRLGDMRGLAQAHHNIGITYAELGFGREADTHLGRAIAYAGEDGSEDEVARTEQERAMLLLRRGDVGLAEALARRSLRRFERLRQPAGVGLARRILGIAALVAADHDGAREHLDEALAIGRRTHEALLEAETREALAALDDATDRPDDAEAHRRRADELFDALGARRWGARIRERMIRFATDGRAALGLKPEPGALSAPDPEASVPEGDD